MATKKSNRGVVASPSTKVRANRFHVLNASDADVIKQADELKAFLDGAPSEGIGEKKILDWFAESETRLALFACAHGFMPTHVAREFELGDMRSDFAFLYLPKNLALEPKLLLVECQGALEKSMFDQGTRKLSYWGYDFLDGFSQLVDWHFFDFHNLNNQEISKLIQGHKSQMQVYFMLVAGMRKFCQDPLSERRINAWNKSISFGNEFKSIQFDTLAGWAKEWMSQRVTYGSVGNSTPAP